MKKPKVCVLMSTYNGEKYLKQQIDSILSQLEVEVSLYIRDDGSNDSTLNIIKEIMKKSKNITLYKEDNIGVGNSFMELMYKVPNTYEFYSFSDQDDIWDKDKLISGIKKLNENQKKILYASNQTCITSSGESLGLRYKKGADVHTTAIAVLEQNMLAGCTYIFRKELKIKLAAPNARPSNILLQKRIHDVWVINVAALTNGVIYDEESHMLYRQHENNVFGAYAYGLRYDIKQKIEKLQSRNKRNGRSTLGRELCKCFQEETQNLHIHKACINPNDFSNKMILFKNIKELKKYTKETFIGLMLKILFDLF